MENKIESHRMRFGNLLAYSVSKIFVKLFCCNIQKSFCVMEGRTGRLLRHENASKAKQKGWEVLNPVSQYVSHLHLND